MESKKFCHTCGEKILKEVEICPKCGVRQPLVGKESKRGKVGAALFAIFLGTLGLHKFYLGKTGWGIVYILISLLSFLTLAPLIALISIIEGIIYLSMSEEKFNKKYNN